MLGLVQDAGLPARAVVTNDVVQWPKPAAIKCYSGFINANSNTQFIPDLTAADGSGWFWQSGATGITRVNGQGTTIYSVGLAGDINAAALTILGVYPDYADGRLYMLCDGGADNFYLAYTTLAAKAMTVRSVGAATFTAAAGSRVGQLRRAAQGSGNFTFYCGAASRIEKCTITESTGAMTTPTQLLTGGNSVVALVGVNTAGQLPVWYVSPDEKLVAEIQPTYIRIHRGGAAANLPCGKTSFSSRFLDYRRVDVGYEVFGAAIVENGKKCVLFGVEWGAANNFVRINIPRHYELSEMLTFLNQCADAAGCPT